MKKVIAISLLLFYAISVCGISMNLHYCGDTLSSVDIFSDSAKTCGCSEEDSTDDCCKDIHVKAAFKPTSTKPGFTSYSFSFIKYIASAFAVVDFGNAALNQFHVSTATDADKWQCGHANTILEKLSTVILRF